MKINGALRESSKMMGRSAHLKGNTYVNMLVALCSFITKLAGIRIIPGNRTVYRGMSGWQLPLRFYVADERGACGGVDFAFMSTTTDVNVAINYATEGERLGAMVFEIQVGMIDMGADLRWLSQYPGEVCQSFTFHPRSCARLLEMSCGVCCVHPC